MLCKVKKDNYYTNQQVFYNQTINTSIGRDGLLTLVNNQLFNNSHFAIIWDSLTRSAAITLKIDGNYVTRSGYSTTLPYFAIPYTTDLTANANHTVQFYNGWSGSTSINIPNCKVFSYKDIINITPPTIKGYSSLIKELWELGSITTFWVKENGGREYGPEKKLTITTSATAGSITPWNYKGYITITDSDGTKYKIGFYDV